MTEAERMSRQALVRRAAAVAAFGYTAPVLTSHASAETQACDGTVKCKAGKKGKKKR